MQKIYRNDFGVRQYELQHILSQPVRRGDKPENVLRANIYLYSYTGAAGAGYFPVHSYDVLHHACCYKIHTINHHTDAREWLLSCGDHRTLLAEPKEERNKQKEGLFIQP